MHQVEVGLFSREFSGVIDRVYKALGDVIPVCLKRVFDVHTHGLYHCLYAAFLLSVRLWSVTQCSS
jgi:hypothetical protein